MKLRYYNVDTNRVRDQVVTAPTSNYMSILSNTSWILALNYHFKSNIYRRKLSKSQNHRKNKIPQLKGKNSSKLKQQKLNQISHIHLKSKNLITRNGKLSQIKAAKTRIAVFKLILHHLIDLLKTHKTITTAIQEHL